MIFLIIGDIFSTPGLEALKWFLNTIKREYSIDFTIANVENLNSKTAKSLSYKEYNEIKSLGLIDFMTSGNHIFFHEDIRNNFKKFDLLVKPINLNSYSLDRSYNYSLEGNIKEGSKIILFRNKRIRITNVIGTSFMNLPSQSDNPYPIFEKILENDANSQYSPDIHFVDFHAETTSEKIAFAMKFDGKITALWGTHTHVQTSDERILNQGTAFITDLGMTGPQDGIIGADPKNIIERFKFGFPLKISPFLESKIYQINAIVINVNDDDNKVIDIKRVNIWIDWLKKEVIKR